MDTEYTVDNIENNIEIVEQNEPISERNESIPYFIGVRGIAVKILSRFERSDAYLEKLLDNEIRNNNFNQMDKGLLTELVNGVIRWKWKLDWVLTGFYQGDYLKCLNIVKNSLRVGLYQILFLNKIPIHAAVNESVEIVKKIQGEKTAGLVNAVLRNVARNIENVRFPGREEDLQYYFSVVYSHPRWMVKRWLERFGEQEAEALLSANNRRPFIPIRINTMKTTQESVLQFLNEKGISYFVSRFIPTSIILKSPRLDIRSLEIFQDGFITIQDTSAALAAKLANPQPGNKVLDLCAAPGGKSFLLAELMKNQGELIAIDKYFAKLRFIEEGAKRLGISIIKATAADAETVEFGEEFDLVVADVPCSGLGTISKKPDIKWKREREDIQVLQEIQRKILLNAVHHVKPGGVILYSTCTTEPEENMDNIKWFLEIFPNFELEPAEKYLTPEVCTDGFLQTFPHKHYIDGAFAARLKKKEN
ncbi:MAG: 16S rRNA (cytosine(967)-C(5))-methyltransferase RsmB [Ignavibacteriae bacterium]|nr:16S rRNA (cytosine(967)-C(5))-methyltransferase RsmB [Ignavibacteriota bacterium]